MQPDICRLIVEKGEEKNPIGLYGETALHRAAKHGHLEICRIIIAQWVTFEFCGLFWLLFKNNLLLMTKMCSVHTVRQQNFKAKKKSERIAKTLQ